MTAPALPAMGPDSNWGRALAYHPLLAHFFGSVNAGIFFGQLAYWQVRADNPLGVYKSSEDWTDETGLSYREQATARKILSTPGYLVETNKRLEHRIYYRIDWDAFNPAFRDWFESRGANLGGSLRARPIPNDETATGETHLPPNDETATGGDTKQQPAAAPNSNPSIGAQSTSQSTAHIDCSDPPQRAQAGAQSDPSKKRAPKPTPDPEMLKVAGTLPLRSGACFEVTKADVARWAEDFPAVNIKQSLKQLKSWFKDNPDRLRTRKGIRRAIRNWLKNDQDAGGGRAPRDPQATHYNAPHRHQHQRFGHPSGDDHAHEPVSQSF